MGKPLSFVNTALFWKQNAPNRLKRLDKQVLFGHQQHAMHCNTQFNN